MKGIAFTILTVYFVILVLALYTYFVVSTRMDLSPSYLPARIDAAEQWYYLEFNGFPSYPELNTLGTSGYTSGCVDIIRVDPYNGELNEIESVHIVRRCK